MKSSQCFRCKRFRGKGPEHGYICEAFPAMIPDEILFNYHDHQQPFPGDNGMLFELKVRDDSPAAVPA